MFRGHDSWKPSRNDISRKNESQLRSWLQRNNEMSTYDDTLVNDIWPWYAIWWRKGRRRVLEKAHKWCTYICAGSAYWTRPLANGKRMVWDTINQHSRIQGQRMLPRRRYTRRPLRGEPRSIFAYVYVAQAHVSQESFYQITLRSNSPTDFSRRVPPWENYLHLCYQIILERIINICCGALNYRGCKFCPKIDTLWRDLQYQNMLACTQCDVSPNERSTETLTWLHRLSDTYRGCYRNTLVYLERINSKRTITGFKCLRCWILDVKRPLCRQKKLRGWWWWLGRPPQTCVGIA